MGRFIFGAAVYDGDMSVVFQSFLTLHAPLWLCLLLLAAVAYLLLRQHAMARLLKQHAQSIGNMDAWADVTDERLDRVDWMGQRQSAPGEPRKNWRKTG